MADEDLQARIQALRASRRAGATATPNDTSASWLAEWIDHRHFDEIDSTQDYVEREHASFDQTKLTVVSANFQTAGRGTRDRAWHATQAQSALMTFFFCFPSECSDSFVNRNAPNVTQILAVSAVDTLRAAVFCQEGLAFGVKWPNDVMVNGKKIGGILARAEMSPGLRLDKIMVGVGVNVNTPQAELDEIERPVWPATSLHAVTGDETIYDVEAFRNKLTFNFAAALRNFFVEGFGGFRERVNSLDVQVGKKVFFRVSSECVIEGTFMGVNDSGHILLRRDSGKDAGAVSTYPSGEIVPESSVPPEQKAQMPQESEEQTEEPRKTGEQRGRSGSLV